MANQRKEIPNERLIEPLRPLRNIIRIGALAIVGAFAVSTSAAAVELASAWAEEEQTSVRLIAAQDGLGSDGVIRAGLEFKMKPGWKIYWRSPGDAGFPPMPEFEGSTNAEKGPFSWPTPLRFSVLGLETLGYEDHVILPFDIKAPAADQTAWFAGVVRYLTCNDVCIPYEAELELEIPPGGGEPTGLSHAIGVYESQVPKGPDAARLDVTNLRAEASQDALYLVASVSSALPLQTPDLYFEGPKELGFGPPQVTLGNDALNATMRVKVSGYDGSAPDAASALKDEALTLTILDGSRAAEIERRIASVGTAVPSGISSVGASTSTSILLMLLFAYLGGLILNLMPCVLPVLSIKLLSLVKLGGADTAVARSSFLASAAGIVFAFMLLAAALIGLKAAGAGIGWGIQFQQPWFLIAMAILVTLFACNLWGFFEFRLPGAVAKAGHQAGSSGGLGGNFAQGMFATLLATPCSAPFLGTAVGFALARGPLEISAIFFTLGLGLATPYLLVSAVPSLATRLPKPGPWMDKLRIGLGFALAATAIWLLSVIAGVSGVGQAIVLGAVLAAICIWLGPILRIVPEIKKATPAVLLLATLGSVTSAYLSDEPAPLDPATASVSKISWQAFDPVTIERLTAAGKIVFVDVTADWCITCLVNKRLVLEQGRVIELLNGPDVIAMQADWTRPDPAISNYLASFNRFGIPFNAVYGPEAPSGVPLPEILTEDIVLGGFQAAVPAQLANSFQ